MLRFTAALLLRRRRIDPTAPLASSQSPLCPRSQSPEPRALSAPRCASTCAALAMTCDASCAAAQAQKTRSHGTHRVVASISMRRAGSTPSCISPARTSRRGVGPRLANRRFATAAAPRPRSCAARSRNSNGRPCWSARRRRASTAIAATSCSTNAPNRAKASSPTSRRNGNARPSRLQNAALACATCASAWCSACRRCCRYFICRPSVGGG